MALVLDVSQSVVIGIDEFLEYAEREVDPADEEAIVSAASMFKALVNNETLVPEALNRELMAYRQAGPNHEFASVLRLGQSTNVFVRACVWTPPEVMGDDLWEHERFIADYDGLHNHPDSFLTGGYFGNGYETDTFLYQGDQLNAVPGDEACLEFNGTRRLVKGQIMLYRKSVDAHLQKPPADVSISVNAFFFVPGESRPQYIFDLESNTIASTGLDRLRHVCMLANILPHVADGETLMLADEISARHPHPRVRRDFYAALIQSDPSRAEHLLRRAGTDHHAFVRDWAFGVGNS